MSRCLADFNDLYNNIQHFEPHTDGYQPESREGSIAGDATVLLGLTVIPVPFGRSSAHGASISIRKPGAVVLIFCYGLSWGFSIRVRFSAGTCSEGLRNGHGNATRPFTTDSYPHPGFESSTSCTNSQPKRPLMHRWPRVTSTSRGEVTLTIRLFWTCKVSVQPTPQ